MNDLEKIMTLVFDAERFLKSPKMDGSPQAMAIKNLREARLKYLAYRSKLNIKGDDRPYIEGKGWAPGHYECKCNDCGNGYSGEKRSSQCADCAYKGIIK